MQVPPLRPNLNDAPPLNLEEPPKTAAEQAEEDEALRTSIQAGTVAQIVVAILASLAICYAAKLPLVVICTSILIAFLLEPLVALLCKLRVPRSVGAIISILVLVGVLYGLTYFFYQRAIDFSQELPKYRTRIQHSLSKYQKSAQQLQQTTNSVMATARPQPGKGEPKEPTAMVVKQEDPGFTGWVKDNFGTVSEVILTTTFIPFLVYFMLTWKDHLRRSTVKLFNDEHRRAAYRTLGKVSDMMRTFLLGNFYIALFTSACSITVFGFLHLPYFYFTGVISGFVSVVPYLGILLAVIPPIATGLGGMSVVKIAIICVTVLGLHLFSMNVLYPKILGKQLQLNPLVVTLSLLIWGWIWGAMGLILAVPIAGAIKVICDNIEQLKPFGEWMGE